MAYNTGNQPGSTSAQDLIDNSEDLDLLMTGEGLSNPNRLGVPLKSWKGMEADFSAMLLESGFESVHLIYVPGTPLSVARPTQLIDYSGSAYRIKMPASFPVVLSGVWVTDAPKLLDVGDMSARLDLASAAPGKGDAMVVVKQPTANSVAQTLHDTNLERVSLAQYGGKDDYNGTTGTNSFAALNNLLADYPNGCTIHLPRTVGGTGRYYMSGSVGSADMSKYVLSVDSGVDVTVNGTNTPLVGPGLVVTRPLKIRMVTANYTFYLSPTSYGELSGKPYALSPGDGESPIVERIITSASNTMQFKTVNLSTGALVDTTASTDGDFASFGPVSGAGFTIGTVAIRPGQEVHAQITLPSNAGKVCAVIETEGGWVLFAQDAVTGGNITRYVFLEGFAIQVASLGSIFGDAPAYNLSVASLGIKVHSPRSFSVLLNHVEVSRMDERSLTSDILRAGWGAGLVTNANPAYISYPSRVRENRTYGMRPLRLAIVGDSTSVAVNPFSMANHVRRIASGVGGVQFKTILNQAVSGATALNQRDLVNATDYAALGGFDYMLIDLGINDIGGGTSVANYVQAIVDIVTRCDLYGMIPLVALPAMFYDQPSAAPYGQTGQGTANADRGAPLRLALMRKLAEISVQAVLLPIQDMGAILPSNLGNANLSPVVQDNVHQSNWGGELKGMAWAKALIGFMYARVRKSIAFRTIKGGATGWVPTAQQAAYGNVEKPAFGIKGDHFFMGNRMNIPAAGVFGTKIIQLPAAYAPEQQMLVSVVCAAADQVNSLSGVLRIDPDGSIYIQTMPTTATWVQFSGLQWDLKVS